MELAPIVGWLGTDRRSPLTTPSVLVLTLDHDRGRSCAIVGDLPAAAFADGSVRPHEATDPARIAELTRHLESGGTVASAVAVVQRPSPTRDRLLARVCAAPPTRTFDDPARDEVVRVWAVADAALRCELAAIVADGGPAELADGHHRAGAAVARGPRTPVLTAVWTDDGLHIAPFHRRVTVTEALAPRVRHLRAEPRAAGLRPLTATTPADVPSAGTWHVALGGDWFVHDTAPGPHPGAATGAVPDVVRVHAWLHEHLGVTDAAIEPVPPVATGTLDGPATVGVALHPPSWDDVRAVSAAGATLPPKSTYVVPKLRAGLLVVPRDPAASTYHRDRGDLER